MNSKIYIADCYIYDQKAEDLYTIDGTIPAYRVKLTDGNYFIKTWFPASLNTYQNKLNHVLYLSEESDIYLAVPVEK